jgi:hypothetical protein
VGAKANEKDGMERVGASALLKLKKFKRDGLERIHISLPGAANVKQLFSVPGNASLW